MYISDKINDLTRSTATMFAFSSTSFLISSSVIRSFSEIRYYVITIKVKVANVYIGLKRWVLNSITYFFFMNGLKEILAS